MNINRVKLIYFSPTKTTQKISESIASGVKSEAIEHIDLTPPDSLSRQYLEIRDELVIIGCPVYSGRLPIQAISRLKSIRGNDSPAAIVVVYGNRAYEDALLELRDLAIELGFKPIAAASFIGEHSYSNSLTPIAVGRPDPEDLTKGKEFGAMINAKLRNMRSLDDAGMLKVPGKFPYRERTGLLNISPVTQRILCSKCEACVSVCPIGAITIRDEVETDSSRCIRCCACVKVCPEKARIMNDQHIVEIAEKLSENCSIAKWPDMYI